MILLAMALLNDTSFEGVGGTMRPMKAENRDIRLVRETIRIQARTGKVQVTFVFKNEGKAQSVTMGFPEDGYDASAEARQRGGFKWFKSSVDGKPLKVVRSKPVREQDGYTAYWVKSVPFARGQERKVLVQYQAPFGSDTMPSKFVQYTVSTGANWKGKIGLMRIFVDLAGVKTSKWVFTPNMFTVKGTEASLIRKEIEPKPSDNLRIAWMPEDWPPKS